jgi:curved DNA-binding protein CbpA
VESHATPSARSGAADSTRNAAAGTRQDPWSVLGVSPEADDEQIRVAYVQKVKEFPPDRSGPQFERVRDAYEQLKDPYRRAKYVILGANADRPLESLLEEVPDFRRYVGPEPWLAAMKSQPKEQR